MSEQKPIQFKRNTNSSDETAYKNFIHNNSNVELNEHERAVLRERTKLLAQADDDSETSYEQDYLCFKVGNAEKYGIAFEYLDEILEPMEVTAIPNISPIIAGVVNRRGTVLNVIDASVMLGVEESQNSHQKPILVLRSQFGDIGLLIDDLVGMSKYDVNNLHPAMPSELNETAAYVEGIWDSAIAILNVDALMDSLKMQFNEPSYS